MGQLNVLGAQRVKALIEMLKAQEATVISDIQKEQLTLDEAKKIVNAELGVQKYFDEIESLKERIIELSTIVKAKTGVYYSVNRNSQYDENGRNYSVEVSKVQKGDTDKRIADVKADFKRKEQRLWLCETLEDAKAIVGIE